MKLYMLSSMSASHGTSLYVPRFSPNEPNHIDSVSLRTIPNDYNAYHNAYFSLQICRSCEHFDIVPRGYYSYTQGTVSFAKALAKVAISCPVSQIALEPS